MNRRKFLKSTAVAPAFFISGSDDVERNQPEEYFTDWDFATEEPRKYYTNFPASFWINLQNFCILNDGEFQTLSIDFRRCGDRMYIENHRITIPRKK